MTLAVKDGNGLVTAVKSTFSAGVHAPHHHIDSLPGTVQSDTAASKGFLETLAGAVTSSRLAVDLTSAVTTYLQTLANTVTSSRVAVDLSVTVAGYLQTLAGAVTSARVAVDLATTPTANLATLAGAVTAARLAVNVDSTLLAKLDPPTAIFSGQASVTGSAAQLQVSSQTLKFGVVVKAKFDNTADIFVGPSGVATNTGFRLRAGEQSPPIPVDDINKVYAISASGSQSASWLAS